MFYYRLFLLVVANGYVEVLTMYGNIYEPSLIDSIKQAVLSFQETYNLQPSGLLNNATLETSTWYFTWENIEINGDNMAFLWWPKKHQSYLKGIRFVGTTFKSWL